MAAVVWPAGHAAHVAMPPTVVKVPMGQVVQEKPDVPAAHGASASPRQAMLDAVESSAIVVIVRHGTAQDVSAL